MARTVGVLCGVTLTTAANDQLACELVGPRGVVLLRMLFDMQQLRLVSAELEPSDVDITDIAQRAVEQNDAPLLLSEVKARLALFADRRREIDALSRQCVRRRSCGPLLVVVAARSCGSGT